MSMHKYTCIELYSGTVKVFRKRVKEGTLKYTVNQGVEFEEADTLNTFTVIGGCVIIRNHCI